MADRLKVALLGATGSIGKSTLSVLADHPDRFELYAVAAGSRADALAELCAQWQPSYAVLGTGDGRATEQALRAAGFCGQFAAGADAVVALAALPEVDIVVSAVVGAAGLNSTLKAAESGKRILLANKEALVVGGALVMQAARKSGAVLLPVDSEHNAIFQCLPAQGMAGVEQIWLTASGGPFRELALDKFASVTPEQAVQHPNWRMGAKISVDSATMMNKGLEVIEAHYLFELPAERIGVVVHPQSVVHSLVEYVDGSFLAQLGAPDMRTPIAHALGWPKRLAIQRQRLDLWQLQSLSFSRPDAGRFPCLGLAFEALKAGGAAPVVLNAANEVAVQAFLERRLRFDRIPASVNAALSALPLASVPDLAGLWALDAEARRFAEQWIAKDLT